MVFLVAVGPIYAQSLDQWHQTLEIVRPVKSTAKVAVGRHTRVCAGLNMSRARTATRWKKYRHPSMLARLALHICGGIDDVSTYFSTTSTWVRMKGMQPWQCDLPLPSTILPFSRLIVSGTPIFAHPSTFLSPASSGLLARATAAGLQPRRAID